MFIYRMYKKNITLLLILCSFQLFAQNTIQSPFSSFGLGERSLSQNAITDALGFNSITYIDSTIANFNNPASYNSSSGPYPLFSIGLRSRISFFEQNGSKFTSGISAIDHIAMSFTIKKYFGFAFGFKSFSRRGYDITENVWTGSDSIHHQYKGSGSANEAFLGLSSTIFKIKSSHLSVGANLGYVFGTVKNERKSNVFGSSIGGSYLNELRFNTFHYELGLYFSQKIAKNHSINISSVLEPSQGLKAYQDKTLFYASDINNENSYTVLSDTSNVRGKINIAPSLSFGIDYSFKFNMKSAKMHLRNSELKFLASFTTTDWSKYSTEFNNVTTSSDLPVSNKISFGVQFTPEYKLEENKVNTSFFGSVKYRLGYYQYNLPFNSNVGEYNENALTFGFGIPINAQKVLSSVNLGFALGQRTSNQTNAYNEQFIGINLGIIIAPSNFDSWFRKRKVD